MPIPDKLPIARLEGYHTYYLGKCEDGRLFWGYDSFVFTVQYTYNLHQHSPFRNLGKENITLEWLITPQNSIVEWCLYNPENTYISTLI